MKPLRLEDGIWEGQPMGWLFLVYTVARGESKAHRLR